MKKRFIVLIDFSEYSANLLRYANDWSTKVNAEILLVHRAAFVTSGRISDELKEAMARRIISEALEDLRELSLSTLNDVSDRVRYKVTIHPLTFIVAEILAEPGYDNLIFAGLKGTGLLKQVFMGSVAIDIIEQTKNCVVAMPKDIIRFAPERIFVAVKEEYPLNIPALDGLLDFFGTIVPPITFFTTVHKNENIAEMEKQLSNIASHFSEKYVTTFAVFEAGNFIADIKNTINNKTKELLIVQKGSRLFLDQLFRKFIINELIFEGQTPLIVLP